MRKRSLIAAVLVACAVCSARNMLKNGEMRTSKGWTTWGDTPRDAASKAKIITYVKEGPNGARVLKFNDCFTLYNPYLIQLIPVSGVTEEQKYHVKFSLKADKGRSVTVMLQMFRPDEERKLKFLGGRQFVAKGTGEWTDYETTFTRPYPDATHFGLSFNPIPYERASDKKQTCSFLLTNVSLELEK